MNGGPAVGRMSNSRLGATLSLPLRKKQSLKVGFSTGATARAGQKFTSVSVAWQFMWFDHHPSKKP